MFWLTYQRYPGSGTNLTPRDVHAMEWRQIMWWADQLRDAWDAEVTAINGGRPVS